MRNSPRKKPITTIDSLFSLQCGLTRTGDIKMDLDYVDPEVFVQAMKEHAPEFESTWHIASLLRYLKTSGDDIMNKANGYIRG